MKRPNDKAMTEKEQILQIIENLPNDATVDDAMEALYFFALVASGLKDADEGRTVTHAEAKARLAKFLQSKNQ